MNYVNCLLEDNSILSSMLNDDSEKNNQFLPFTESALGYENFQANKKVKMGENTDVKRQAFMSKPDLSLVRILYLNHLFQFSLNYEQNIPKQYRDLKFYFDYDRWVEWVNETGCIPKGKPDPKKKKKKIFHLKLRDFKF